MRGWTWTPWMVLALACSPAEQPLATPPAAPTAAPAPPTAASAPRSKELARPEAAAVGTLPDGVGLAPGQPAPDAEIETPEGAKVTLRGYYGAGAVLVVFYRGGWCPFCNFQVRELAEAWPELQRRGVTPVMVSVDRVEEAAKTQAAWTVPFPVLSDPDLKAHEAFRVVHEADAAEVERLRGFGMDLEAASGRTHHRFAIPSMFLVDVGGVVRWAHADLDYKVRPSTEQILAAIDEALPAR